MIAGRHFTIRYYIYSSGCKKKIKIIIKLFIFILICFFIVKAVGKTAAPAVLSCSWDEAENIVYKAVDQAVFDYFNEKNFGNSTELVEGVKKENQYLLAYDVDKINRAVTELSGIIEGKLEKNRFVTVKIPVQKLLGISLVLNKEIPINININTKGSVRTSIDMAAKAVNNNTSLYTSTIKVYIQISIITPFGTQTQVIKREIPFSEILIFQKS